MSERRGGSQDRRRISRRSDDAPRSSLTRSGRAVPKMARRAAGAIEVKAAARVVGTKGSVIATRGEQVHSQHVFLALQRELTKLRELMAEMRRETAVLKAAITKPEINPSPSPPTTASPGSRPRAWTRG